MSGKYLKSGHDQFYLHSDLLPTRYLYIKVMKKDETKEDKEEQGKRTKE